MHAAFISGSYQPEGRSAVKVGKLIGVPRRFTALPVPPFPAPPPPVSPLPPFSPILFDRFPTFRKVAALIKHQNKQSRWNSMILFISAEVTPAIFGKRRAIVRLAFRSFYLLARSSPELFERSLEESPRRSGIRPCDNFAGAFLCRGEKEERFVRFRYFRIHIFGSLRFQQIRK